MNRHWTEEDFLKKLYQAGSDDAHLRECPSCRSQWEVWIVRRRQVLEAPAVPLDLLERQRLRIEECVRAQAQSRRYLKPALAVACTISGLLLWKSSQSTVDFKPVPPRSDAQLMGEIYQTVYDTEPTAVQPIQGLFERRPIDTKERTQ